jgi:hypothetical protein
LVPASATLARQSNDQVEMLRIHLLEKSKHAKAATLLLVKVGHVVSELEIVRDLGLLLLVHFSHNESGNVS